MKQQDQPTLVNLLDLQVGDFIYMLRGEEFKLIMHVNDIFVFDEEKRVPVFVNQGTKNERRMTPRDLGKKCHYIHISGLIKSHLSYETNPFYQGWRGLDITRFFSIRSLDGAFVTDEEVWMNCVLFASMNRSRAEECGFYVLR